MANKRMFNLKVIDTDAFLDLPLSTQALYFHLCMRADDDGFIANPKRIQKVIGASEDDLKLLLLKRFILVFDNGVIVIKHWRMHNTIQKDRYTPTIYQEELKMLEIKGNKAYTDHHQDECIQTGTKTETKCIQTGTTDIDIDLGIDLDINTYSLPLKDNSNYTLTEEEVKLYKKTYPNVNIDQEVLKMIAWLKSNPEKRKTAKGIKRFINGWLAREQDKHKEVTKPDYSIKNTIEISEEDLKKYLPKGV